jgi:GNAT superfamily N-acetyltransferase
MAAPHDDRLTFRQDYFGDPAAWTALVDLLRDIFSIDVSLLDQFGRPDPTSMPFGYFNDAGLCVANFSGFSMPVVINGREVKAAGFQSGAVRPDWRGRGLYRDLLNRAFAWTDSQGFELGLLLTDKPALYEPYGFRTVPQYCFEGEPPPALPVYPPAATLALPGDGEAIKSLLLRRTPVSRLFAVTTQMEMFLLNGCFDPEIRLSRFDAEDVVVAWKFDGTSLRLLDIVGPSIPPLASIISGLGIAPRRVEVCFPTDRLEWTGRPKVFESYTVLMMRGAAADELGAPVMLSPMAEF